MAVCHAKQRNTQRGLFDLGMPLLGGQSVFTLPNVLASLVELSRCDSAGCDRNAHVQLMTEVKVRSFIFFTVGRLAVLHF